MPGLHPDQRAVRPGIGRVLAAIGKPHPATGGIVAGLIVQVAFQDQDFLAAGMGVERDLCLGIEFDQSDIFVAKFVEWQDTQALDPVGPKFR